MVCILRKPWLEGRPIIKLEHPIVGLCLLPIDQTIIIVCMNQSLDCYSKKGRRLWTVSLPQPALCMVSVHLSHLSQTLICVGLRNGLVQLYAKQDLVDQFTTTGKAKMRKLFNITDEKKIIFEGTVSSMIFGKLGQEDHVLVLVTIGKAISVTVLFILKFFNHISSQTVRFSLKYSSEQPNSVSTPTINRTTMLFLREHPPLPPTAYKYQRNQKFSSNKQSVNEKMLRIFMQTFRRKCGVFA